MATDAAATSKKLNDELENAIRSHKAEKVIEAIQKGADVNASDAGGSTPLHRAVYNNQGAQQIIDALVAAGAKVDQPTKHGETPLHEAVNKGNDEAVGALIAHKANVNALNKAKESPLHIAVGKGSLPIVRILVANGANVEQADTWGASPLHMAAQKSNSSACDIIGTLLESKSNIINKLDRDGSTPLYCACKSGIEVNAKTLLDRGADITIATEQGKGFTPLHVAAMGKHDAVVRLLLAHGAKTYFNRASTSSEWTPLHCAALTGEVLCVQALVEAGADFTIRDRMGRSPFDYAKERDHQAVVDYLQGVLDKLPKTSVRKVNLIRKGFTAVIGVCFMAGPDNTTYADLRSAIEKDEFLKTVAGGTFAFHTRNGDEFTRIDHTAERERALPETVDTVYISSK